MTQINQYSNEITPLGGLNDLQITDYFDVDKLIDADTQTFESQKMTWGTLQTYIAAVGGANWGNTDLTVTDNRIHNGNNLTVAEINLENRIFELNGPNDSNNGFLVSRTGNNVFGADFITFQNGTGGNFKYYDNGSAAYWGGQTQNVFFGDDTPVGTPWGAQSNRNFLATFASDSRKTVFTDTPIPPEPLVPVGVDPADSVAWFRSTSKGVLFPNLTEAARNTIPTPRTGLVIYNIDSDKLQVYTGIGLSGWSNLN